jgi:hypothetical protein
MELDNNCFGTNTIKAFAESLLVNESLVHLSLDSNPLTGPDGTDVDGIVEFSKTLAVNKTLKFLNLWGTHLGIAGGQAIAEGLEANDTILFCDISHNSIHSDDAMRIAAKLDQNLSNYEMSERQRRDDVLTEEEKQKIVQAGIDVR